MKPIDAFVEKGKEFIRRLLCRHRHLTWIRNIHGDEIIAAGYRRSWWCCETCGKRMLRAELHAVAEVEELRDWVREILRDRPGAHGLVGHFGLCQAPHEKCTCGLERIKEIVG